MSDDGKKFVLRAPGSSVPPSDVDAHRADPPPASGPPPTLPDTAGSVDAADAPVMSASTIETGLPDGASGSLAPITISEMKAPPPRPAPTNGWRIGSSLLGVGCVMACLFPTLPWYSFHLKTLDALASALHLPDIAGVRTWTGLVCLIGGIAMTALLIVMLLPKGEKRRETLGLIAGGCGALVGIVAIYTISDPGTLAGTGTSTSVWVALTALGGFLGAAGGFMLRN